MNSSLRERDGAITENWYIACLSKDVKDRPFHFVLYDRPYVLFRDENNKLACLPDRCMHRHALLSEGQCVDGKLKCPYHGWTFNSEGEVTDIPSEGPRFLKGRLKMPSIPVIEQDEVVWVWAGSGTPKAGPSWRFPKIDENGWVHYFMVTDFDNEVTNLAENFMDVPHTVFVHKGWFRDKKQTHVPMTVKTSGGRVLVTYDQTKDEIGGPTKVLLNPKNGPLLHTDEYIFPNITRVDYYFDNKYGFIINSQISPVSNMKSRVYTYIAYKLVAFNSIFKPFIQFYTRQVITQDVEIMANQAKALSFDSKTTFRSTPADELHIAIERLRSWGVQGNQQIWDYSSVVTAEFWI